MTEIDLNSLDFSEFVKDVLIFVDKDKCNGCGICGEVCPFGLPHTNGSGKYEITRPELCTECSACKRNCPTQAIVLNERSGCGCLWNAKYVAKNEKRGKANTNNCGSSNAIDSNSSCCSL